MSSHAPPAPPRVGVSFGGFDQSDFLAPREVGFHVRNHRTYGAHCAYHLLAAHAQLFLPVLQLVGVTGAKRMRSGLPRLLLSSAMCSVLFSPAVGSLLDRACIGRRRPRNSPRATKVPRHCTHRPSSPHSVCSRRRHSDCAVLVCLTPCGLVGGLIEHQWSLMRASGPHTNDRPRGMATPRAV